eukprot:jgi/Antlo1/897/435
MFYVQHCVAVLPAIENAVNTPMMLERVLLKKDHFFTNHILSVSKVKLFVFKTRWTETNIEGPMFLYQRSKEPLRRFIIFNTKRPRDFVFDFDLNLSYALENQFLMLKRNFVYGVWFYSRDEFIRMRKVLEDLQESVVKTRSTFFASEK